MAHRSGCRSVFTETWRAARVAALFLQKHGAALGLPLSLHDEVTHLWLRALPERPPPHNSTKSSHVDDQFDRWRAAFGGALKILKSDSGGLLSSANPEGHVS